MYTVLLLCHMSLTQCKHVTVSCSIHQLAEIAPIDLLIGGSPCNELSLANPLRKGFDVGKYQMGQVLLIYVLTSFLL